MIERPTVFVLGAGAGQPYTFPTGEDLKREVCQLGWNLGTDAEALKQLLGAGVQQEAQALGNGLFRSGHQVDEWLAINKYYQPLGKYLIARQIMSRETEEKFREAFMNGRHWYAELWKRMLPASRRLEDLKRNQVAFVTFNYDRSLEQSLMMGALNTFIGSAVEQCARALATIPVIHVHGQLGRLPWQEPNISGFEHLKDLLGREYEPQPAPELVRQCSEGIKLIAETNGDTFEYRWAKDKLKEADRVHFLGFGYHEENLKRLKIDNFLSPHLFIGGTRKGVEEWKVAKLATGENPFGKTIQTSSDEDVVNYVFHKVEGWDVYRK